MKKTIFLIAMMLMFTSTMFLFAQEHNHKHKAEMKEEIHKMTDLTKIDKNKDGYVYQCPMKCEAPSDKPGECSKCGMKLEKISLKKMKSEMMQKMKEHKHKTDLSKFDKNKDGYVYQCPMKCEAPSDKPGECSKCGMKLKKVSVK